MFHYDRTLEHCVRCDWNGLKDFQFWHTTQQRWLVPAAGDCVGTTLILITFLNRNNVEICFGKKFRQKIIFKKSIRNERLRLNKSIYLKLVIWNESKDKLRLGQFIRLPETQPKSMLSTYQCSNSWQRVIKQSFRQIHLEKRELYVLSLNIYEEQSVARFISQEYP